jgi:hypothetical protein
MYPYSHKHKIESILNKKNINFYIPGGIYTKKRDWYPFVLTFNDDQGFSKYTGKNLALTILYSFGHFDKHFGTSTYYNPQSPYFSSFYGGYIVYNYNSPNDRFGFYDNSKVNIDELILIPKYDQTMLVLPSLGCPLNKIIFESEINKIQYNVDYIGIDGWVKIDATIKTNSPIHKYNKKHLGYIQYGKPIREYYNGIDFPLTTLKGRIYVKYIEKYKMTFVLYVMAPKQSIIEECDKSLLLKSKIYD